MDVVSFCASVLLCDANVQNSMDYGDKKTLLLLLLLQKEETLMSVFELNQACNNLWCH